MGIIVRVVTALMSVKITKNRVSLMVSESEESLRIFPFLLIVLFMTVLLIIQ